MQNEEWLRDDDTIYQLTEASDSMGRTRQVNKFTITVKNSNSRCTLAEMEKITKQVHAIPDMVKALEAALCWMTNVNINDPATLGRQIMAAMEKAGYDKETLDDAAVALVRGPCSVPNMMGEDDDDDDDDIATDETRSYGPRARNRSDE